MGLVLKPLGMLATGNVRGLISFFLGLALVGALWETSLVSVSSRPTATAVMTELGAEVINPILQHNSFGLSQNLYSSLQQQAASQPGKPITVPGINAQKVVVLGSDIRGKNFADGTRVIYGKVAAAYYDNNGNDVFAVPSQISQVVSAVSLLPQAVANQATQSSGAPQLPSVPLPPLSAVGLSLATLTAQGHTQIQSLDNWFLGIAALLALLLALFGRRWGRVTNVAWAVISSTIPGLFGIGAIWFFWARNPGLFQPYTGLLNAIGSAYIPVYVGAAAAGVAALIVAGAGDVVGRIMVGRGRAAERATARASFGGTRAQSQPAEMYSAPTYRERVPTPPPPRRPQESYGSPRDPAPPYAQRAGGEPWPPASAGAPWQPSPAGTQPQWPPASPADSPWPPQQTPWDQPPRDRPASGPVGPSQPSYGRPAPSEQPWPPQAPQGPASPSPYGQTPSGQTYPGRQPWPPQDDADPWSSGRR
jgi:hypothetical protein